MKPRSHILGALKTDVRELAEWGGLAQSLSQHHIAEHLLSTKHGQNMLPFAWK